MLPWISYQYQKFTFFGVDANLPEFQKKTHLPSKLAVACWLRMQAALAGKFSPIAGNSNTSYVYILLSFLFISIVT